MTLHETEFHYHRNRVDVARREAVWFAVLLGALAFTISDKFEPLAPGASLWSSTTLVWTPETRVWKPAEVLWKTEEVRDRRDEYLISVLNQPEVVEAGLTGRYVLSRIGETPFGRSVTREVYPNSYSALFVLGSLLFWGILFRVAQRHTTRAEASRRDTASATLHLPTANQTNALFLAILLVIVAELILFML